MPPLPLHSLQHQILETLRAAKQPQRYADLRLREIENDLFNYHLQQLVKRDLVTKLADGYELSRQGRRYLVDLHPLDERGMPQRIKLAAMCIVADLYGDEPRLLYQTRSRQPLADQLQMIGGGLLRGELPTDAASRRLAEEAGLIAKFRMAGFIRFRRFEPSGELYSDILFHACVGYNPSGSLIEQNEYGKHTWLSLPEAVEHEAGPSGGIAALKPLLPMLMNPAQASPLFYLEVTDSAEL